MKIKLQQLKNVVAKAQENEKFSSALREEVVRVTNYAVLVEDRDLGEMCAETIDHVSTVERLGGASQRIKTSLLLKMAEHTDERVRQLASKMLPEGQLYRFMNDRSYAVRSEVARRCSLNELKTLIKRNPIDDNIKVIYKERLAESDKMLYLSGKKLGDVAKQDPGPLLSDSWYENLARIIFHDIKPTINNVPMYNLARQFAQHTKSTSGVEIDADKLVDALNDLIDEHEEKVIKRNELRESVEFLKRKAVLTETMFWLPDDQDTVEELLENYPAGQQFIERFEKLFMVEHAGPNRSQKSILLREGIDTIDVFPVRATLPTDIIRSIDEKALDRYVDVWNRHQMLEGNTLRLSWDYHGGDITFGVTG